MFPSFRTHPHHHFDFDFDFYDMMLAISAINGRCFGMVALVDAVLVSPHGAVLNYKQKYRTKQVGYAASPW